MSTSPQADDAPRPNGFPRTVSVDPHPDWTPIPIAMRFRVVRQRSWMALTLVFAGALVGLFLAVTSPPQPACVDDDVNHTCVVKHVYAVQLAEVAGGAIVGGLLGFVLVSIGGSGGGPNAATVSRRRSRAQSHHSASDALQPAASGRPLLSMRGRPKTHRFDASHASRSAAQPRPKDTA